MNQLEEIKNVISMNSISDHTKLLVLREMLNSKEVSEPEKKEKLKEIVVIDTEKKKSHKRKKGDMYPNAGKLLTSTEIDAVAREYFKNGNKSFKKIGMLIGRSKCAVENILAKIRSGVYKTSFNINKHISKLDDKLMIGDVKVAKNYSKMG